jgi:hypothetical protein
MSHKAIVALFVVAAACLALPSGASARGGHGGGGGFHVGGFHGGGFRGGGIGFGFYGPYYPYGYDGYYGDEMNCHLVRQRVHTRQGWRIRRVEICD